jgi:4,5:9,10-diseco-3-hydroxy-5,9,17-trioxoandrosta-1(10),2-diene-4-oate hydrolase
MNLRTAVGATAPWREAVLEGVRLAYDDEGQGPAVVCLHAIGHGAGDFARFRRAFAADYRVLAPDWPGQGNSGDDPVPPSVGRYAELLGLFLDRLGLEKAALVGNSIGGAAALRYAADHPDRVTALVLENPGGLDPGGRLSRMAIGLMVAMFRGGERRAWWFGRAFRAYYATVLTEPAARGQREKIVAAGYELAPTLERFRDRSSAMPGK